MYDREGAILPGPNLSGCSVMLPSDFCEQFFPADISGAVGVVSLNTTPSEINTDQRSPILSAPIRPGFSLDNLENFLSGLARLGFEQHSAASIVSNEGVALSGEPVTGFAIQQFTNGMLIDQSGASIRANYRSTLPFDREPDIRPFEE